VIHTRRLVCDWTDHEKDEGRLRAALEKRQAVALSFIAVTTFDAPALQRIAAEIWTQSKCPARTELGPLLTGSGKEKIRVGYFSADFHDHATCCLMAELFESHDKERFELFAFSFGPDSQDEMRQRVSRAFDRFIDVRFMSDMEVARMARELEIDIAIDLKGYTQDARPGIFSYRCAPVQVNYLGYPGTMGAEYMDYLIADKVLIPAESLPAAQLPGERYEEGDFRPHLHESGVGLARDGLCLLLLQQQLQDHAHHVRQLDADPEGRGRQCSLAFGGQR
jgi:predicted O-linked N-acetylglucosamine transferase (SPINDLY family)